MVLPGAIRKVSLLFNPYLEASPRLAEEIAHWLAVRGIESWPCSVESLIDGDVPRPDLMLSLGGDGTILRAIHRTAGMEIPVLGINLGRIGFLTEASPQNWSVVLDQVLAGQGWLEQRTMLRASIYRGETLLYEGDALNDAVISRGAQARTVKLVTRVDGAFLTRYVADGLILATATGSTAYAYAVGGPVLPPWLHNLVLVPAAPHLSLDRPLVLDAGSTVEVIVHTALPGMLTLDGQEAGELVEGDRVVASRSPLRAHFWRLGNRDDFFKTLVARLTPRNGEDG